MKDPWPFRANCNDCRAELQAVLDELVELDVIEPGWGPLGGPCHPYRYHNVRPSRWSPKAGVAESQRVQELFERGRALIVEADPDPPEAE